MLIRSLLNFGTSYLIRVTGEVMANRLRSRVYQHLQVMPMSYYQDRKPGEMLTLLSNDSQIISDFVTSTVVTLLPLLVTFFGAFVIMFLLDPLIAILAASLLPVYYVAMKLIGRRLRPLTASWIESWSDLVSLVQENLGMMPALKAFLREPVEARRFEERNTDLLVWSKKRILIQSLMSPAISLLAGAGPVAAVMDRTETYRKRSTGRFRPGQPFAIRHDADPTGLRPGQCLWKSHAHPRRRRALAGVFRHTNRTPGFRAASSRGG